MNRSDFQTLSLLRLEEAEILLANGKYEGAYYLAGYVVECGLKACIARRTNQFDFPPSKNYSNQCFSHVLGELVGVAGLDVQLKTDMKSDPDFEANWTTIVKGWSEQKRYERPTQQEAEDLIRAIADSQHGVLRWLMLHW